jgi:hypothetical protein
MAVITHFVNYLKRLTKIAKNISQNSEFPESEAGMLLFIRYIGVSLS